MGSKPSALERARRRADIEWIEGTAAEAEWGANFELATMMGHAFQNLISDQEVRGLARRDPWRAALGWAFRV